MMRDEVDFAKGDTTVAKFGLARYKEYDGDYAHFVGVLVQGRLGGRRMAAVRA
jgi:hypothetical protein